MNYRLSVLVIVVFTFCSCQKKREFVDQFRNDSNRNIVISYRAFSTAAATGKTVELAPGDHSILRSQLRKESDEISCPVDPSVLDSYGIAIQDSAQSLTADSLNSRYVLLSETSASIKWEKTIEVGEGNDQRDRVVCTCVLTD